MSEKTTKKKEYGIGSVKFDMNAESTSSRSMYNLAIGLTVVAGCALNYLMSKFVGPGISDYLYTNPKVGLIVILALYLVGSFAGIAIVNKAQTPAVGILGFGLLACAMGLVLSVILPLYPNAHIAQAFLITMAITAVMTVAGALFPAFFSSIGKGLAITLLITIIAELLCSFVFFRGQNLQIFDYVVIFIFCGYIGFDWSRAQQRPSTINNAIRSAAAIYVDVVNIFIRILSIMGKRRD